MLANKGLVSKVYIWYPFDNEVIKNDIMEQFQSECVEFVHGPFKEVIEKYEISNLSTFVFSQYNHINELLEMDKLEFSSLILPLDFNYNLVNEDEPVIDLEKCRKDHVFKYDYFSATSQD